MTALGDDATVPKILNSLYRMTCVQGSGWERKGKGVIKELKGTVLKHKK